MIRRPPRSTRTDTTLSLHDALPISYVPGKAASDDGRKLAKLSANENPLGTSPKAREAFMAATADLATYPDPAAAALREGIRSEEHTSELQSLMRISYAVFCLKQKKTTRRTPTHKDNKPQILN